MSRFLILSSMILLTGLAAIRIQAADPSSAAENQTARVESATTPAASLLPNGGFEDAEDYSSDPQGWFGTSRPPRRF